MPTIAQLFVLLLATALFAASTALSLVRLRHNTRTIRIASKSLWYWGIFISVALLGWHSYHRGHWTPVGDNFDALIWLAVLLAMVVSYIQATRPITALDWFAAPMVLLLLASAAVFGRTDYQSYVGKTWSIVHRTCSYGGAAVFAIAAASGAMYVLASSRLRRKQPVGPYLGSLERLEHLTTAAVRVGFALLSVGLITGAVELFAEKKPTTHLKVALALSVWLVYAVVLHSPVNPVFRGRRAAVLSVVGFVLMICTVVAAQFLPKSN